MTTYDLIAYDVWGNEEDGWTVNDAFRTGFVVDVPPEADDTQILALVYADDLLPLVELDPSYCDADSLYVRMRSNHRPLGELRLRR